MEHIFSKIEAYLAKRAQDTSRPSLVPYVFKFEIQRNGANVVSWVLDLKNFTITKGDGVADVTLTVDEETLGQLMTLKVSIEDAVNSGGLKVKGTMEVALKLAPFLTQLHQ